MGSEMLTIHAEKDQTHSIENDDTQTVGHDRTTTIDHDETREVKNNRTTTIDVDETKTVKGKETITITGNQTLEIQQGNQTNTLDQGNQSTTLKMGNQSTELNMGNQSTNVDLGSISMEAMQSITLTVGGKFDHHQPGGHYPPRDDDHRAGRGAVAGIGRDDSEYRRCHHADPGRHHYD